MENSSANREFVLVLAVQVDDFLGEACSVDFFLEVAEW